MRYLNRPKMFLFKEARSGTIPAYARRNVTEIEPFSIDAITESKGLIPILAGKTIIS